MEGDPIEAFTIRKQTKIHGTGQRIEGGLPSGASVVVIEDTLTSGKSVLQAIKVLEDHEDTVLGVLALVDRDAGGAEVVRAAGYPLITLFTAAELLQASGHSVME
jgi:orotate phosphoribosyltransferase